MNVAPKVLVTWLRAAGEPTRLRLLSLCSAQAGLSVSELASALSQSEPRVSRHLRILCEAGLLARVRQGQWVHYRLADAAGAAGFVRGLLAQLDQRDALLARDRATAHAVAVPEAHPAVPGAQSRLDRALSAFVAAGGPVADLSSVLVVGVAHLELLAGVAGAAARCTALAHSRRAAQAARAFAESRGFPCRVLTAASGAGLDERDLARAGGPFDAVLLNHVTGGEGVIAQLLQRARGVIAPRGRIWFFQRYDSLESSRDRIVEHPLARLRRLLTAAGLTCERLSPIEADGEHVLAAEARPASGAAGRALQQGSGG